MKPQTTKKLPGWVYLPLTILMLISLKQTAEGFTLLFGEFLAWAFSIAITLLMYGSTLYVGIRRLNGQPVLLFLLVYFVLFLFSFTGNFNSIYTEYQKEQLFRDELLKHKQQLNDVVSHTEKALNNYDPTGIAPKRARVESLTEQLVSQITDPARPGLGKRALELISEIETVLDEKLTEFGTRGADWKGLAERYRENIDQVVRRKLSSKDYDQIDHILEDAHKKQREINMLIDDTLVSSEVVKRDGFEVSLRAVDAINKIGSDTQAFVKDNTKFQFEKVQFENQEIGKMAFSFKSAFRDHPLVAAMFVVVCAFIDWAVILFLLVFFGRQSYRDAPVIRGSRAL